MSQTCFLSFLVFNSIHRR